jgi:uncharacterized membrane protein
MVLILVAIQPNLGMLPVVRRILMVAQVIQVVAVSHVRKVAAAVRRTLVVVIVSVAVTSAMRTIRLAIKSLTIEQQQHKRSSCWRSARLIMMPKTPLL